MNKELKKIMTVHNLSTKDIARLLNVSERTVFSWLTTGVSKRNPGYNTLELLKLKIGEPTCGLN